MEGNDAMAFLSAWQDLKINGTKSGEKTKALVSTVYNTYISRASAKQYIQGIEGFYSDYKNLRIPLSKAFVIVALGIASESDQTIQAIIIKFRQLSSEK
jgi:hypothetical protein